MPVKFFKVTLIGLSIIFSACNAQPIEPLGPKAPVFVTSDLVISPRLDHSDQTRIIVTVTNIGEQEGTYQVVMEAVRKDSPTNPPVVKTRNVTLAGGASTKVNFNLEETQIGLYKITIGNLTAEHYVDLGSGG